MHVKEKIPVVWRKSKTRIHYDHRLNRGYWLDGKLQLGFPDNPGLLPRERLRIARWAEAIAPDSLSAEQKRILAENPPDVQRLGEFSKNQEHLRAPSMAALYDSLTEEERRIVGKPGTSAARPGVRYPLTVGEIAAVTGATERKIRNWADDGLLPSYRERNDRRFYSAAVILAFVLQRTPTHVKAVVASAARGEAGQAFQLLAATLDRAAGEMPDDEAERLANLAKELAAASKLMADADDR